MIDNHPQVGTVRVLIPAVRPSGSHWRGFFCPKSSSIASMNVAVYIDGQNVYNGARRAFGLTDAHSEEGQINPYRRAKILAAGNARGDEATLVRVEIHRGLPSASKDPTGYGANRRQSAVWMKENFDVVIPRLRPLSTRRTIQRILRRRRALMSNLLQCGRCPSISRQRPRSAARVRPTCRPP